MSTTTTTPSPLSVPGIVRLVAEREILTHLRSVSFLISSGILLLIVLASIVIGSITAANPETIKVATVGDASIGELAGVETVAVDSRDAAEELLRAEEADAAIVPDDSSSFGYLVLADSAPPSELLQLLSVTPPVELLDPGALPPLLVYFVALGFGIVFFASAMTFGSTISTSVVTEKQTRIVEILLAAIPTRALLAGKILGTTVLAFGQIALVVATAIVGLTITGQDVLLAGLGAPLVWFALFFLLGFVLLASLFAATAAMVSRLEDVGVTTTPVTMLVMIPYFLVVFLNDNPLVLGIMSYVPFSAPVAMPLRLFMGTAEWWEPLVALAILLATTLVVIVIGARIYDNSLLRVGARVSLREALAAR